MEEVKPSKLLTENASNDYINYFHHDLLKTNFMELDPSKIALLRGYFSLGEA